MFLKKKYKLSFTHCIAPNCFLIFQLKPEREPYKGASISLLSRLDRKKSKQHKMYKTHFNFLLTLLFTFLCVLLPVTCLYLTIFWPKARGKERKKRYL